MNNDVAIKIDNVSKTFKLPHEKQSSLKSSLINFKKRGYEKQEVLTDVSFEIKKGEFFGIVGRNGSGKSTLLKLIAGIYTPDKGDIQVNGKLTPFIELGVGFNPDLTGRENVYLNGSLLGFSRREMNAMYDDIVVFAELERFMDQKLKNYSSGMQVRLAFSIAIRANSDILLLDEVLAVGDEAFQRKCYEYFDDLKRNKKTVIIVTHDMSAVEKFCSRAILIESGHIVKQGRSSVVAKAYSKLFAPDPVELSEQVEEVVQAVIERPARWGEGALTIDELKMVSDGSHQPLERIAINVALSCNQPSQDEVTIAYTVKTAEGQSLFGYMFRTNEFDGLQKGDIATCTISFANILSQGEYLLDISIRKSTENDYMDFWSDALLFKITSSEENVLHILADSQFQLKA